MNNKLTKFYLVRHGETDWNKQRILQGQEDIPLNETGEEQAKETAKKMKAIPFDLAFSSDLLRAKRTTEIIALEHSLAVEATKLLRERYFGEMQGKPTSIFQNYLQRLKKLTDEEKRKHWINEASENDEEVITRVITFLREISIIYPGKTVLCGTHAGILRLLLIHLGIYSYGTINTIKIENASYLIITSDGVDFFIKEMYGIREKKDTEKQTF